MTDGLLENIIQLEKQIQAEVAAERVRAAEWKKRELAQLDSSLTEEQVKIEERRKQLLAENKTTLVSAGASLEAEAAAWCQRLQDLDDTALREALQRHLAVILPGGDNDHPHGQG